MGWTMTEKDATFRTFAPWWDKEKHIQKENKETQI